MCLWSKSDNRSVPSKVLTFYVLDICEKVALFVKYLLIFFDLIKWRPWKFFIQLSVKQL